MVLMSGDSVDKSENLESEQQTESLNSDSGISNCSKENSTEGGSGSKREKSQSPRSQQNQQERNNQENSEKRFFQNFPRAKVGRSDVFGEDPFFSDRSKKFFEKSKLGNRPRLSERIFGNRKGESVFDNDNFVDDLRRRLQEERKMFFDGNSDPFASAFSGGGGRPTSPVGGSGSASAGTGRTGFPFEDLRGGARARFDEFANRHPMFSTMRNQPAWNFDDPFGHRHGFQRERNNSGSSGGGSGGSTASTGEERVIPIHIIRDDPPNSQPQQKERGKSPAPAPPTESARLVREASPKLATSGPQRCNTEPNHPNIVEENRATRAHSAPPVGNDKFTAKNTVESNNEPQTTQMGGNCSKNPKPEQVPTSNGGVRSIPIVLEGRKAHVVNTSSNGNCSSGGESHSPPQSKISRPEERSPPPPSKKPSLPKDPLSQVNAVMDEVKKLEDQVNDFKGNSRDREYLVLDEMLTRCLIKLDVVESDGRDDVRMARKECIRYIQSCISKLEKKTPVTTQGGGNEQQPEQPMETGPQESKGETEKMDTGSQQNDQKMEVDSMNNSNANNKEGKSNETPSAGAGDQQPPKV